LRNFNLSVGTDAEFWAAHEAGERYDVVNPRTGAVVRRADPVALLDRIAEMAWRTGDPGLLFLDTINEHNPTPHLGRLEATNPCGEVPLLPYEACMLGSVDLGRHTAAGSVDWGKLRETVHLGVMGLHDALVDLGIPYDSADAVGFAEELMAFVHGEAWSVSRRLAEERGPFPEWEGSVHEEPVRNATTTTTTIAPTGTISLLAGCSAGIEPIYSVAYTKHVLGGLEIVDDRFVEMAREREFYTRSLLDDLHDRTSIQDVTAIPTDVRRLFRTAHDVSPIQHLRVQAAFQAHVDNAVSKTVNLPASATVEDVTAVFRSARDLDLKGITVFRSGARPEQILGEAPRMDECAGACGYSVPRCG
jgi:ribonucleoside-diphosphate reductase alpha chain